MTVTVLDLLDSCIYWSRGVRERFGCGYTPAFVYAEGGNWPS